MTALIVGCGDSDAAGEDPTARAQTEQSAKDAMLAGATKTSKGSTALDATRRAMQAGSRSHSKQGH